MNDEPNLQKRLHELRDQEAAFAPSFEQVLRGPVTARHPLWPRLTWLGAAAAMIIGAAMIFWPRSPRDELPEVSPEALANLESVEWTAPTDALLAGTNARSVPALSREIEQLLHQP